MVSRTLVYSKQSELPLRRFSQSKIVSLYPARSHSIDNQTALTQISVMKSIECCFPWGKTGQVIFCTCYFKQRKYTLSCLVQVSGFHSYIEFLKLINIIYASVPCNYKSIFNHSFFSFSHRHSFFLIKTNESICTSSTKLTKGFFFPFLYLSQYQSIWKMWICTFVPTVLFILWIFFFLNPGLKLSNTLAHLMK